MTTKFGQKLAKIAQISIPCKKSRNISHVNTGLLNSNMLPEFSTEPRELPWQPKLCKNKPKFRRFQFSKSYRDNVYMYRRVFVVGEFKYANKNFRGAKGVAINQIYTKRPKINRFQFCTQYSANFYIYDSFSGLWNSNMLSEFFREHRALLWQPNRQKQVKIAQISLLNFSREQYGLRSQRIHIYYRNI